MEKFPKPNPRVLMPIMQIVLEPYRFIMAKQYMQKERKNHQHLHNEYTSAILSKWEVFPRWCGFTFHLSLWLLGESVYRAKRWWGCCILQGRTQLCGKRCSFFSVLHSASGMGNGCERKWALWFWT